jgi:hypothetical protein
MFEPGPGPALPADTARLLITPLRAHHFTVTIVTTPVTAHHTTAHNLIHCRVAGRRYIYTSGTQQWGPYCIAQPMYRYWQGCGSGFSDVVDPDSVTLWIRIRIGRAGHKSANFSALNLVR